MHVETERINLLSNVAGDSDDDDLSRQHSGRATATLAEVSRLDFKLGRCRFFSVSAKAASLPFSFLHSFLPFGRTSDKDGKLGWLRDVSPSQGLLQSAI